MIKKKSLSTWIIVFVLLAIGGALIWFDNPLVHLSTKERKLIASVALLGVCLAGMLSDDLFTRLWKAIVQSEFSRSLRTRFGGKNSTKPATVETTKDLFVRTTNLRQALRQTYGRFWPRKVRILLLTI